MSRRLLMLALLLTVETGCPHAWGRGGTIDMAVRKDINESWRDGCWISKEAWYAVCGDEFWRRPKDEWWRCPESCRPPKPL